MTLPIYSRPAASIFFFIALRAFAKRRLGPDTHHNVRLSCTASRTLILVFVEAHLSLQPLLGMEWSDAMALSIVVGIPDLSQIYMEPMETASSNLHVSGVTYSPQGVPFVYSQDIDFQGGGPSQLSPYWAWNGVMPWPYPLL